MAGDGGELRMELYLPMPPTDNHIYINIPYGRKLSKTAKRYKAVVKEEVSKLAVSSNLSFRNHIPYCVRITLFMDLYTKGWPSKALWKFRKVDATNRTKLLLDAVSDAVGIDDRHFVTIVTRKEEMLDEQCVRLSLEELCPR